MNIQRIGNLVCAVTLYTGFALAAEPSAEALRDRIDAERAIPAPVLDVGGNAQGSIDIDDLVSALETDSGESFPESTEVMLPTAHVGYRFGPRRISYNSRNGHIVLRDDRGYSVSQPTPQVADGALIARSRDIGLALGVQDAEANWQARELMSRAMTEGGVEEKPERLAHKVFVTRVVGGIPVAADQLVFSYANDGSLRKILGQWRRIDLARSRLTTRLARPQIVERALQEIDRVRADRNLVIRDGLPIPVKTHYLPEEAGAGVWTLRLVGVVGIPVAGPEGGHRWSEFEFSLE